MKDHREDGQYKSYRKPGFDISAGQVRSVSIASSLQELSVNMPLECCGMMFFKIRFLRGIIAPEEGFSALCVLDMPCSVCALRRRKPLGSAVFCLALEPFSSGVWFTSTESIYALSLNKEPCQGKWLQADCAPE